MKQLLALFTFLALSLSISAQSAQVNLSQWQNLTRTQTFTWTDAESTPVFTYEVTEGSIFGRQRAVTITFPDGNAYTAARHQQRWIIRDANQDIIAIVNNRNLTLGNGQKYSWKQSGWTNPTFTVADATGQVLTRSSMQQPLFQPHTISVDTEDQVLQAVSAIFVMTRYIWLRNSC